MTLDESIQGNVLKVPEKEEDKKVLYTKKGTIRKRKPKTKNLNSPTLSRSMALCMTENSNSKFDNYFAAVYVVVAAVIATPLTAHRTLHDPC